MSFIDATIRYQDYRQALDLLREAHLRMGNTAFPSLAARIATFLNTAPSVHAQPPLFETSASPSPVSTKERLENETLATDEKATREGQNDRSRLDHLDALIRNCPHAQITFCDDPDCEQGATGFMIRVEGCETFEASGETLRQVIDRDMAIHSAPSVVDGTAAHTAQSKPNPSASPVSQTEEEEKALEEKEPDVNAGDASKAATKPI